MVLPARDYLSGEAFTAGIGFDGCAVRGFKSIEESDMIFMPDAKTLSIMPWVTDEKQKSAKSSETSTKPSEEKSHRSLTREVSLQKEP